MSKLFCRLTKATVDAPITQRPGISPNGSPCADTPTGYTVSKNQNSGKWRLLPKLVALLLLLQVFAPSITLNAQTVWTSRTSAADNFWQSVTYGNNLFVAVATIGTGNRVMTSNDGITWTIRTSAADNQWTSVTYGNGIFVTVASGAFKGVMRSSDGINWTNATSPILNDWTSVTYGCGSFVAVANNGTVNDRVMTSPDGNTWTNATAAVANDWSSVTYGNGLFVAVSVTGTNNDRVMTSPSTTVVAAPTTSNQSVCGGATVADLVATPAAGNTIVWYATATGGTPLASSTPLVNATKYYAAQVTPSNCESSVRAVDSVTIQATVAAKADSSYCKGSNIAVNFVGASGNTYTWTATQNGTGIAASGTGNTSFTGANNTNAVVKDTVIVTSSYNPTAGYTISDGTYAFADTTGSTYLSISSLFTTGGNSNAIPVGFDFKFFGTNFSNVFISTNGLVAFDAARTKVIEGQRRTQSGADASSKIAYKTTGSAPNRKFIISFIEFNKPNNTSTGGDHLVVLHSLLPTLLIRLREKVLIKLC